MAWDLKQSMMGRSQRPSLPFHMSRVSVVVKLTCHGHMKYGWFRSQIFLYFSFLLPTLFLVYFLLPPIRLDFFFFILHLFFVLIYFPSFFVLISLYFQLASSKIIITLVPILQIPFSNLYQKIQWLYASQAFRIIQGKFMNCNLHRLK